MTHSPNELRVIDGTLFDIIYTQEKIVIMKKMIQMVSFLGLLLVFTAVGANAQSAYGTEVNIPFAFNVGNKAYDAGHYVVKVTRQSSGTPLFTIQDTKTDEVQQVLLNVNGDAVGGELKLMFATVGARKFLSKVHTPLTGYSLIESKTEKDARRGKNEIPAASIGGGANLF